VTDEHDCVECGDICDCDAADAESCLICSTCEEEIMRRDDDDEDEEEAEE
jgi:hypothetical protein